MIIQPDTSAVMPPPPTMTGTKPPPQPGQYDNMMTGNAMTPEQIQWSEQIQNYNAPVTGGNPVPGTMAMPGPPTTQPIGDRTIVPNQPPPPNMSPPPGGSSTPYSQWDQGGTNQFFQGMGNLMNMGNNMGWNSVDPNQRNNQYGGQQIAGADPSQADYGSVQQYSDAAYENSRRYLDPQQKMQNQRFDQELINKGIDPNSPQGQQAAQQLSMQQADANNAAAFGAMQFGQGIQNQMAQQEQQKAGLAGQMELGTMQNQLGWGNLGLGYGNLGAQMGNLGLGYGNLDVQRGQTDHQQLMDMLGYENTIWQQNQQQQLVQDLLFQNMYGTTPIPGMSPVNPLPPAGSMIGSGDTTNIGVEFGG